MNRLKYKVGDKVIYKHGAGGFSPALLSAEIIFAHKMRGQKLPLYIVKCKYFDTFSLERDLKPAKNV